MPTGDDELERLRSLVGPSESSYRQLSADLDAAVAQTEQAESVAGQLRGRIAEMSVQLARARQDQDTLQRRREMGPGASTADLGREWWREVVRPLVRRAAHRVGLRRGG